jgi:stress response protein YsnF
MYGHNVVAVFSSRADAERARDRLIQSGIPVDRIRLSEESQLNESLLAAPERRGRFWDWLFGTDIPERDRTWYETNLREGRTAVSVLLDHEAERDRIGRMLEEFHPIDFDHSGTAATEPAMPGTGLGAVAAGQRTHHAESTAGEARMPGTGLGAVAAGQRRDVQGEEEQVIPVVREELDVGKRATERRYRIHTYVLEKPVEEAVTLRDERVVIEHRPVGSAHAATSADMPAEREYEVIERHEEPVVAKRARTEEEIVVRKEANERTETVRDTVRETKVDVDKDEADRASAMPERDRQMPNR